MLSVFGRMNERISLHNDSLNSRIRLGETGCYLTGLTILPLLAAIARWFYLRFCVAKMYVTF